MEVKPCVLVLSNTNTKPQSLIKLISKSSCLDDSFAGTVKCNWTIDSKYYTAEVCLVGIEVDFERSEDFNDSVEALIMHMDTNKSTGLKDLDLWEKIIQDCDPDVKIVVANYCDEGTKVTRTEAIEWCLKKKFEFIELYPLKANEENTASDFEEKVGVERIIEALHSHTWLNLKMKSQNKKRPMNKLDKQCSNKRSEEKIDDNISDDSFDDFTELFSQLHTMRESLNSLPSTQRKQCAEQMVTAFWKAIGGDEEELPDS